MKLTAVHVANANGGSSEIFTNHPPPPPPAAPAAEMLENVYCPITFEPMLEARILQCGHTFSKDGLEQLMSKLKLEKKRFYCPSCLAYFEMDRIATNFSVQSMARFAP
jgi:hypothetical protein